VAAARYRLLSPDGGVEDGSADVGVASGALVVAPQEGDVLRVPFGKIATLNEAGSFVVRLGLADGTVIELSRLGVMRTQLLAELRDGRGDDAAKASAAVGDAESFAGVWRDEPARLRVYEDALIINVSGGADRVSFSFARAVTEQAHVVTIEADGREPVVLTRIGRRTDEFVRLLRERIAAARSRTAAFLGALLPGLGPVELRRAAGLLRDGVAVPLPELDGIHPGLADVLLRVATLPARQNAVAELRRRADVSVGFKQAVSVRRAASGTRAWRDPAAAPHIAGHDSPGGSFAPGAGGLLGASLLAGWDGGSGGFTDGSGAFGAFWAFRALGAGGAAAPGRAMAPRPDVSRGALLPAADDVSALVVSGDSPTVLAFILGEAGGRVVFEVLNHPGPPTMIYRLPKAGGLAAVNRALDDCGFRPVGARAGDPAAPGPGTKGERLLAGLVAGKAAHDGGWPDRIAALLPV
jgi:hypothetical protein